MPIPDEILDANPSDSTSDKRRMRLLQQGLARWEQETLRLSDMLVAKQREVESLQQDLANREGEILTVQMQAEHWHRRLEQAKAELIEQEERFSQALNAMFDERIGNENQMIQVVAEKERTLHYMQLALDQNRARVTSLTRQLDSSREAEAATVVALMERDLKCQELEQLHETIAVELQIHLHLMEQKEKRLRGELIERTQQAVQLEQQIAQSRDHARLDRVLYRDESIRLQEKVHRLQTQLAESQQANQELSIQHQHIRKRFEEQLAAISKHEQESNARRLELDQRLLMLEQENRSAAFRDQQLSTERDLLRRALDTAQAKLKQTELQLCQAQTALKEAEDQQHQTQQRLAETMQDQAAALDIPWLSGIETMVAEPPTRLLQPDAPEPPTRIVQLHDRPAPSSDPPTLLYRLDEDDVTQTDI